MSKNIVSARDVKPAHPVDQIIHATLAQTVQPLSPASSMLAYTDWLGHVGMHAAKESSLLTKALDHWLRLANWTADEFQGAKPPPCIKSRKFDKRFCGDEWQYWPFNFLYQAFLLQQDWWDDATTDVRGIQPHHEQFVNFFTRQALDIFAPSNFLLTNPQALDTTVQESGANLLRGTIAYVDDVKRTLLGAPPRGAEDYPVGERIAATPGKVVYRNSLIELIQYAPATDRVRPQPVLFIPAWIMKYYILDLQQNDSLVKYMVDQGYTVFMISWKNPGPEERDTGFDDYRTEGVMAAFDAVSAIVPDQKIHSVGYCIGGTLLMVAAAHMARIDDERLASMTLFASLADFSEPGELGLFIDPGQVTYLEDLMWQRGYLGGARMRSAFLYLRSLDLIWSRYVREYLLGQPHEMFDLMAWNGDTTNLPYRMHSEYLRRFYLNNDLVEGRYVIDDEPAMLLDIRVPVFCVGTSRDHIAPWKSVYRINRLTRTEVTFALTSGGHNVGVVNPPGNSHYHYQIHTRQPNDKYLSSTRFHEDMPRKEGSWWPAWVNWLNERSGEPAAPPQMGAPTKGYSLLNDAPGTYVYEAARAL